MPCRRLLVVEDEINARDALAAILRQQGFEVTTASDGAQALRLFDQEPFAVVVTDIRMPGMTGLELLRHLSGRPCPPRVIVMSADDAEEGEPAARLLGAVAFMRKPLEIDDLIGRLRQAFA